ncbi:MAG: septum formation initiator family protein [Peptococcaceae bacterium]|jgi:cell division protein DivIC|nr:septum formation initiator family protein [Peptococcaceae bacterium]
MTVKKKTQNPSRPAAKKKTLRKRLLVGVSLIALCCAARVGWQIWQQSVELDRQIAELNQRKAQLTTEQKSLQLEIARLNTPSYIEQLAREQLGLVRHGEIIIAPKK